VQADRWPAGVDVGGLLEGGGVFAPIRESREVFEQVRVNPETRTVKWPGEVDLDPDVLYGRYEPASDVRSGSRGEPSGSLVRRRTHTSSAPSEGSA
jgi:hypothetical protein